jgi:hypothetical protein
MRTYWYVPLIMLVGSTPATAQEIDIRAETRRVIEAQGVLAPPCVVVEWGLCMKQAPRAVERFERWTFIGDNVCAALDLATTLFGIGANILVERNPALQRFSHNAVAMTFAKAGIQVGKQGIRWLLRNQGPRTRMWTGITWTATASFTCAVAFNNHRETQQ